MKYRSFCGEKPQTFGNMSNKFITYIRGLEL